MPWLKKARGSGPWCAHVNHVGRDPARTGCPKARQVPGLSGTLATVWPLTGRLERFAWLWRMGLLCMVGRWCEWWMGRVVDREGGSWSLKRQIDDDTDDPYSFRDRHMRLSSFFFVTLTTE